MLIPSSEKVKTVPVIVSEEPDVSGDVSADVSVVVVSVVVSDAVV